MSADRLDAMLQTATRAARVAGETLMQFYRNGVTMRRKSAEGKSYDLVSDADEHSERQIAEILRAAYPRHELLGEEALHGGDVEAEDLWIIDPLDGTNNFAHRVPHFAVSIAHYHRGRADVGVVFNPVRDELYTALAGRGAWFGDQPIRVDPSTSLSECLIGCGFYYDRGEMMRKTLSAIDDFFGHDIHGIRRFGTASLDLCAVAQGIFGGFFEYQLSPWDFAAGRLIVQEAGGSVTDGRGNELPSTRSSVCASNGRLHDAMIAITRRHHP